MACTMVVVVIGFVACSSPTTTQFASETSQAPAAPQESPAAAEDTRAGQAQRLCETVGQSFASNIGRVDGLARAHPASVRAFVAWEEAPQGGPDGPRVESLYRSRAADQADQLIALCYFDGDFTGAIPAGPPPPPGAPPREGYTRLGVSVTEDGEPRLYVAGRPATLPLDDAPDPNG